MDSKHRTTSKGPPAKNLGKSDRHHKHPDSEEEGSDSSQERHRPRKHQREAGNQSKGKERRGRRLPSRSRSRSSSGHDSQKRSARGPPRREAAQVPPRREAAQVPPGYLRNPHAFNNAFAINDAAKGDPNVRKVSLLGIIDTWEVMQVFLLFMKQVLDQYKKGTVPSGIDRTLNRFLAV